MLLFDTEVRKPLVVFTDYGIITILEFLHDTYNFGIVVFYHFTIDCPYFTLRLEVTISRMYGIIIDFIYILWKRQLSIAKKR